MAKKGKTSKAPAKAPSKASKVPQTVTLANIARDEGANPKTVRTRFRKLYAADDTSNLPQPVQGGSRWTFASKDREALIALVNAVNSSGE